MFKIGEFSKLTQVSIRMLRYYDEADLLKPASVDPFTGYRLYSAHQIPLLNKIIFLRDTGFSVAEISALVKNDDDARFIRTLEVKQEEIRSAIHLEQEKILRIEQAKEELLHGSGDMHYHVVMKQIPSYQVLSLRRVVPDYYEEGTLWAELSEFVHSNHIPVSESTFTIYHDVDYRDSDVDIELCVLVNQLRKDSGVFRFRTTDPVDRMACTMVYGDFKHIKGAYLSFAAWLQDNSQYEMGSQNRQIVHRGPWNEDNPDHYVTEIQIPLGLKKNPSKTSGK